MYVCMYMYGYVSEQQRRRKEIQQSSWTSIYSRTSRNPHFRCRVLFLSYRVHTHITTYMYDKMRKYRALMYSTYVSAFSKEDANKYCTILYKYMYHTYMHTYITFLRIGTSDHSRKLSNTGWLSVYEVWNYWLRKLPCCPIVFNSAASDYYMHTYICTYDTCMLVCLFVGTTAFRMFPMSMGPDFRTGIPDEHVFM